MRKAREAEEKSTAEAQRTQGKRGALWLLGGAEGDFADEALRGLLEQPADDAGNILGLEHSLRVLACVRGEGGLDRTGQMTLTRML